MRKIIKKIPYREKNYIELFLFLLLAWLLSYFFLKPCLNSFGEGLLIEGFGTLLDLFFLSIVIVLLNEYREKQRRVEKREEKTIDDLKSLETAEAIDKKVGSIRRMNKQGITEINLDKSFLKKANLKGADLRHAYMSSANLEEANLEEANLKSAQLDFSKLSKANLRKANLQWADLFLTDLSGADLKETDLRNATFYDANLEYANLDSAILKDADFRNANFEGIRNITIEQLSKVYALYNVENLDPELKKQIKEKYPHLLEEPKEEVREK